MVRLICENNRLFGLTKMNIDKDPAYAQTQNIKSRSTSKASLQSTSEFRPGSLKGSSTKKAPKKRGRSA
jgi:hypothetical protein